MNLVEYNIEKDKGRRDEMLQKSGSTGVPVLDIEGLIVRGFNENAMKDAVEKRRSL